MKTKKTESQKLKVYAVAWSQYDHNEDNINCGTIGVYKTLLAAKKAVWGAIEADAESIISDYEGTSEYKGCTPKSVASGWTGGKIGTYVHLELPDGREVSYSIEAKRV